MVHTKEVTTMDNMPVGLVVYMGGEHYVLCHLGRHTVVTSDGDVRDDGPCECKR